MEEKFRERLVHVKEEFAKELKYSTQEMSQEHQKDLGWFLKYFLIYITKHLLLFSDKLKAKMKLEKDNALQELAERHRQKQKAVEEEIK